MAHGQNLIDHITCYFADIFFILIVANDKIFLKEPHLKIFKTFSPFPNCVEAPKVTVFASNGH